MIPVSVVIVVVGSALCVTIVCFVYFEGWWW